MNNGKLVRALGLLCSVACLSGFAIDAAEPTPVRVLIVDGQNNHDWRSTTPVLRAILVEAGFAVEVATVPAEGLEREKFRPSFEDYDVVLGNYSDFGGPPAPQALFDKLTQWVADGGGFVAVHAATAGFEHLPEYVRMTGLGWGNPQRGDRVVVDADGNLLRTPKGEGGGTGHGGPDRLIEVTTWGDHPIIRGLPRQWRVRDELWFAARGPAAGLTVLATGYAPQTEQNEPILWTVDYGQGRVFVHLLGHDANTMRDISFRTTLARGCQWAATGRVTLPKPAEFESLGN